MLKNNLYVYGNEHVEIPAHCNYGKDILNRIIKWRHRIALINADTEETLTYGDLARQAIVIARWLSSSGVTPGSVIAVCSEKRMEVLSSILGIVFAGCVFTPANETYGKTAFLHRLDISKPKLIFFSPSALEKHGPTLDEAGYDARRVVFGRDPPFLNAEYPFFDSEEVDYEFLKNFEPTPVNGWQDNVFIIYSSGTTGLPKGIPMTHLSLLLLIQNGANEKVYSGKPIYNTREWYFTYGLLHTLACLSFGSTVIFSPSNTEKDILQAIEKNQINIMQVCPTTVNELAKSPLLDNFDVSSLEYMVSTSTPCDPETIRMAKTRFPGLNAVYQLYGMSEVGVVCNELGAPLGPRVGSVGCVSSAVIVKVVDVNTREPLGANQRGEICFKSLGLMKGYIGIDTSSYLDNEGFYKTGDIGFYDEDKYFFVVDRVKEMIKYNDISVAPAEFEAILLQHPMVYDAGVVGAKHPVHGEVPVAFVVAKTGASVSNEELIEYVNAQMSSITKLVGGIRFVEKLPRFGGKLDRKALKLML